MYLVLSNFILLVFFEYRILKQKSTAKLTAKNDIELMWAKIILAFLFEFFCGDHAILSVTLVLISLFTLYNYYFYQPYYNKVINALHIVLRFLFFWSSVSLFLCLILKKTKFEGGLSMFLLCVPVVVIGCFLIDYKIDISLLLLPNDRITNGYMMLKRIKLFLYLIDKKDERDSRKEQILLMGVIRYFEMTCVDNNCVLKQYLNDAKKEDFLGERKILLLQHAESMYKVGIRKFPGDIKLRLSYGNFLFDKMNKKQKGLKEYDNLKKYKTNFEEEFLIYKSKKLIEEEVDGVSNDDGIDFVSAMAYKAYLNNFKSSIIKVSMFYIDFWGLLLLYDDETNQHENFEKMSEIGKKISKLVNDIKENFEKMDKIHKNEPDVLRLYSLFLSEILNEQKKAQFYQNQLLETNEQKHKYDDSNLYNLNFKSLMKSEEYKYIILSANNDSFGEISHLSLNVCTMFGFLKSELLGQSINVILPEIYQEHHDKILISKFQEFKKVSISSSLIHKDPSVHTSFHEVFSFGRNKSKYLVPVKLKTSIVSTEEGDNFFIAKFLNDVDMNWENIENQVCYILTDNELMIQNFTSNSIKMLGLNSSSINNSIEITEFIKEFNEDFLKHIIHFEDNIPLKKKQVKLHIINKKYRVPNEITWKISTEGGLNLSNNFNSFRYKSSKYPNCYCNEEAELSPMILSFSKPPKAGQTDSNQTPGFIQFSSTSGELKPASIEKSITHSNLSKKLSGTTNLNQANKKEKFFLSIEDIMINGGQVGFLFKFETVSYYTQKRFKNTTSIITSLKHSVMNDNMLRAKGQKDFLNIKQSSGAMRGSIFNKTNGSAREISIPLPVVSPDFIPQIEKDSDIFHIDLNNMAFKSHKKNSSQSLRDKLKEMAFKKITAVNKDNEESEKSEYSEEDDYSYFSSSSSNQKSLTSSSNDNDLLKDVNKKESVIVLNPLETKRQMPKIDYYPVDMSNIVLLVYDYKRGGVTQIQYEKISEVDEKIKSFKLREDFKIKEVTPNEKTKDNKAKKESNKNTQSSATPMTQAQKEKFSEKVILTNLIKKALHNKDIQPSILNLFIVSFLIFIVLIVISVVSLIVFVNSKNKIHLFFQLILQSVQYHQNLIYSIYNVRELTILKNDNYTNLYDNNKTNYINTMYNKSESYFISSAQILEDLSYILNNLKQSEKNKILSKNIEIKIITNVTHTKSYTLQMFSALVENNMALYHVSQTPFKEITAINENVFYFIYNSLNDIMEISKNEIDMFLDKFLSVTSDIRNQYYMCIGIIVGGYILVYFVFVYFFERVEERKESYLAIFYQIGNTFIVTSLAKCEKFSQKIQIESESDDNNVMSSSSDEFDDEENELSTALNTIANKGKDNKKKAKSSKKKNHINNIKYAIVLLIVFFCLCLYSCAVFIVCLILMNKYDQFAQFVFHHSNYQNKYLFLFTTVRELLFDHTNTIKGKNLIEYSKEQINSFYEDINKEHEEIQAMFKYLPNNFKVYYDKVRNGDLCSYELSFFTSLQRNGNTCEEFLYGSLQKGLYSLLTTFVEEIRQLKNQFDSYIELAKTNNLPVDVYNNTLYGTNQTTIQSQFNSSNTTLMEIYETINPMNLFNSETHKNLIITYNFIFKEIFTLISNKMNLSIEDYFIFNSNVLYALIWLFIGIVSCLYFFAVIPVEVKLNEMIFKTKNMLSIIPKEVLAAMPQIKNMLDIDNPGRKIVTKKNIV